MINFKKIALLSTTAFSIASVAALASEGATEWKKHNHHHHHHKEVAKPSPMTGFYVTAGAGVNFGKYKSNTKSSSTKINKTGSAFYIGLGKTFNDNFRADITLNFIPSTGYTNKANKTSRDLQTTALFINGYYHFMDGPVSPYLTAGIGGSRNEYSRGKEETTKSSFAWQIGAGVSGSLNEKLTWDAGYRYVDSGKFKHSKPDQKRRLKSHQILVGVRLGL